jgi:hypothetical protein
MKIANGVMKNKININGGVMAEISLKISAGESGENVNETANGENIVNIENGVKKAQRPKMANDKLLA